MINTIEHRPLVTAYRLGVATMAMMGADVGAQDESFSERDTIRIEVTGSNIKRTDTDGLLPLQIITRTEIERAGWTTAAELMSHVAANFNGRNDRESIGQAAIPGFAGANLRGIGEGYTLVLLNGRRLANYAFLGFAVDLSVIPFAAVERVEILRDGASSIYGSDAIAGVVNFVLRKDYRGFEVSGHVESPEHRGADQSQVTATVGFGDLVKDRYNAFINVDWQRGRALAGRDREFARTGYRPEQGLINLGFGTFPGGIEIWHGDQPEGTRFPSAAAGCAPPLSRLIPEFDNACAFDFANIVDIVPPTETVTLLARGTVQVAPDHQLFAEYSYARRDLQFKIAPTAVSRFNSNGLTPIRYPAGGPFYPTEFAAANGLSGDLDVQFRTMELGPRINETRTQAQRLLLGAEGRIGSWDYNTAYDHSVDEARDTIRHGYVSTSRLAAAMLTGLINPFGPSGDEGRRLLETTEIAPDSRTAKGTLDQVDFRASTQWGRLPGGAIGFAAGAEARRERLEDHPTAIQETGDVQGLGSKIVPEHAARRVGALFVEANLPFIASVEAQLSARYDYYSDFGGTTNPKVALRWQPSRALLFRGAWGTGFRAPTLADLHGAQVERFSFEQTASDPLRCPVTHSETDCDVVFRLLEGGNPDLKPEHSTQYTFGVVWEPVVGTSASIHYWHMQLRDVLGSLDLGTIFDHIDIFGSSNVVRGPPDAEHPSLPGPIHHLIVTGQNVGRMATAGFDIDLRARSPALRMGRFSAELDASYLTKSEGQLTGFPAESSLGRYGFFSPVPRWRHYAAVNWERGAWNATLAQTFQTGYSDENPLADGAPRRVSSYSIWDVQGSYTGVRNLTVTLGVRNLFDRDPPFTNGSSSTGWERAYADPRGRTYYATLKYAFAEKPR